MSLKDLIKNKQAKIAVIGLGYVGLPLAVECAKAGYKVVGVDVSKKVVNDINNGKNHIKDVADGELGKVVNDKKLKATSEYAVLKDVNIISICVPTPLTKMHEPDISYIEDAAKNIKPYINGQLIVLESTTYPGTTDEDLLNILTEDGAKLDTDFFLAFSPERVDPGNEEYTTKNTPKVVGGVTKQSTENAELFYNQIVDSVVPVSNSKVAEMTKLLENIYRCVNIALVNELALLCDKMNISIWDVIDAASTKPFGFKAFYPGPGLGGHCIPIDPFYLSWKAKEYNFNTKFIELAGEINTIMPQHVVIKVADALNSVKKSMNGSNILILGVAYKKDVDDLRESPAIAIAEMLVEKGASICYHDPLIDELVENDLKLSSVPLDERILKESDCTLIITDHSDIDYDLILKNAQLIVDTRNIYRDIENNKIVRL